MKFTNGLKCQNHRCSLSVLKLISGLMKCSTYLISCENMSSASYVSHVISGFNIYVKEFHIEARNC